jgi:hypothetical protein
MPVTKKTFLGGVNQDDADFLLDPKEYLGALNIRFATSEGGEVGRITNIEGTVIKNTTINSSGNILSFVLPSGINRTIGAYEDTDSRRMFWFNWNSNGNHGIYCYDSDDDLIYTVLKNTILDFQSDKFIHSVSMADSLLYWTDNYNEPRRINVDAAIKMNHPSYNYSSSYIPFTVKVTTAGSGYANGTYNNVPLTGGSGAGATATIVVSGGAITSATIVFGGSDYLLNDTLSASNVNLGGTGSGLVLTINMVLNNSVLTVIRNQPWAPLTVAKSQTVGQTNNFIADESFQFSYRFVYRDNEVSTFSPLSKLIDYNSILENIANLNTVDIAMPLDQKIELDVIKVEFAVKYMTGGAVLVFKTIEDLSSLTAHNAGTAITFKFYNDTIGVAVDGASAVKPYDSVPLKAKTLEIAKNRLFLGNLTDGYDTPKTTSLSIGNAIADTAVVKGGWYMLVYRKFGVTNINYILRVDNITSNAGYYQTNPVTLGTPLPSTVNYGSMVYMGIGLSGISIYLNVVMPDIYQLYYLNQDATITQSGGLPIGTGLVGSTVFKSDSYYRAGVVFFDGAGRKSGVVSKDNIRVSIPDRDYNGTTFYTGVNWSLNNISAVSEIPNWATHYAVVRTKCLRASLFFQMRADSVHYIPKNDDGTYGAVKHFYASNDFGVAINVKSLFSAGLGYSFNAGDILKLYISGVGIYSLKIKDTYGSYIITELVNLGNTSALVALYEVYTSYIPSTTEYFYEVGQIYKVNNQGTPSRQYSNVSGTFTGDVTLVQRTIGVSTFLAEAMSPIDKYWQNWYTDAGRVNIEVEDGQREKPVTISYSNVIIPGTRSNGLSSFDVLDFTTVPQELGGISRLVFTSKVQSEGTVLLGIGEGETASIYIGETQVFDNTGSSFLAKSTGVIGNVNVLKGSKGTIHPESAFEWEGSVIFFDANHGAWVRYDGNGLYPISDNKMIRYFRRVGQDISNYYKNPSEYNLINPNLPLRVLGAVDPFHDEYILSMPRMFLNPKNSILADMELTSITTAFTTVAPQLTATPNTLSGFTYVLNSGPSTSQSFTISGTNLIPNGTVSVPCSSSFEVSTDNITFSCLATLPYTGSGNFAINTIYVRMKAGKATASYNEILTITGGGASTTVSVQGSVTQPSTPTIIINPNVMGGLSYVINNGPSISVGVAVTGYNLSPASGNVSIPTSSFFEFSLDGTTYSTSLTLPYTGGALANTNVIVRLKAGQSISSYTEVLNVTGGSASASLTLSGNVTDIMPAAYVYDAGVGMSVSQACNTYVSSPQSVYSMDDPSQFGVGSQIFIDLALTSPLTGYTHIFINGSNWDLNPSNGVVIAYSSIQC